MAKLAPPTWVRTALLLGSCLSPLQVAAADASVAYPLLMPVAEDGPSGADAAAWPRLTITSDSPCPSEPDVAAALAALVPRAEWPRGKVRIQTVADGLVVDLLSDESTQRQVRVAADCGLRATTVALVIATWTGELLSDAAGAPVLRGQGSDGRSKTPAAIVPVTAPALAVAAATDRELGVGLLLSLSGGLAPGVRIDFVQTGAPKGLGWQMGLVLPAQRERAAGGGTTSWTRAAANLAANGRVTLGPFAASADAGLAVTYTFTSGHGYSINNGSEALTGGLVAGARLALPWVRVRIWTDVQAYKWLFPQAIAVNSPEGNRLATVDLPSLDFQWAMGLAYLFH